MVDNKAMVEVFVNGAFVMTSSASNGGVIHGGIVVTTSTS